MNSKRWQKIKSIFDAALEIVPAKRGGFLDKSCPHDTELRQEVQKLLDSYDQAEGFIEDPAVNEVASLLLEPTQTLKEGQRFAHYEVIRQIGVGGMGEVYLARDEKLERKVAIKILNERFSKHESNLKRFMQEAKAASSLNHPNILIIHEIKFGDDANYIVSEYVEGKTLRELIQDSELQLPEILDIAIQISGALAAAHHDHLIHRDIKPENVIVRPDGYVKLLDFGLAKLLNPGAIGFEASTVKQNDTAKGVILGTVNYMSPEQAKAEKVDERTDIFSLGVVIYELISGKTPFRGNSMSETFANLINLEPQPLTRFIINVPEELQRIVSKTLRKKKTDRYQTIRDLNSDLQELRKRMDFEEQLQLRPVTGSQLGVATKLTNHDKAKNIQVSQPTNSIAVLPFANISSDPDNDYFCDGLAEELLNSLTKIKDLKVAARTSAFALGNRNTDLGEIGTALNVRTVLEGSVRKLGDQLRISVRLINTFDGYQIWAERYDGEMKDVFDLQDKITFAVINELKVKFLSEERMALRQRPEENIEAYQLYLKGRFHYLKLKPTEIQKAISYFEQAIEIDPNYALAYVGLAQALQTLPLAAELPAREFSTKAKVAALKAIEIDDLLAEAHGVLAWLLFWFDRDWQAAEKECRRAIELNPESADAHEAYAHLLSNIGRHSESLAEIERAKELDPLNLRINALEGQFLLHAGKIDNAISQLNGTIELEPNFWLAHLFMASAYIEKGKFAKAVDEASKAGELSGGSSHAASLRIFAYARSGKLTNAKTALGELKESAKEKYIPPYHLALSFHGFERRNETFENLELALEQQDPKMAFLKVEPKWNDLRDEPRFQAVMRHLDFPVKGITEANYLARSNTTDANESSNPSTRSFSLRSFGNSNQNRIFAFGLIILLAAIGFGYYYLGSYKTLSTMTGKRSLAVLPFINASQDPNAEYLSDGISESVINNLSQLSELKVMSRNSAFRFRDNQTDTKNIASQLGVETLVTGDIKQLGDKLIINVRLIDASDNSQIWGNQYVKTANDLIAVQGEIANAVAQNLRIKLTNSDTQLLNKRYTENVEAWQLYQRGRYLIFKLTPQDVQQGNAYFQQAIDLDPSYALAYAGLSSGYRSLALGSEMKTAENLQRSKAAAQKAVDIDDSLSDGHTSLGMSLFWGDWDWSGAEEQFKRALELNPNDVNAHLFYAHLLSNTGQHEAALAEAKRSRELDPLFPFAGALEGQFLLHAGHVDEALDRLKKTFELAPGFWMPHLFASSAYTEKEMFTEAVAEADKASRLSPTITIPIAYKSYALVKLGKADEVRADLEKLLKTPDRVPPSTFALIYNALGETDKTFEWLEKAYEERDPKMTFLKVGPSWNNLRSEPRFIELMKKMKFD